MQAQRARLARRGGRRAFPFEPAIVEASVTPARAPAQNSGVATPAAPVLEVEIGAAHLWIWRDADIGMATAILRALRTEYWA